MVAYNLAVLVVNWLSLVHFLITMVTVILLFLYRFYIVVVSSAI